MKKLSLFLSFFICMTMIMAFPVSANKTNGINTKGTYDTNNNVISPSMNPNANMNRMNNNTTPLNGTNQFGMNDNYYDGNYANGNTGNRLRNNALNTNNYRTNATTTRTNNMSWGWLGLLGLIGLAGMRSRDRERS